MIVTELVRRDISTTLGSPTGPQGPQGNPGGNIESIGPWAMLAYMTIPEGTDSLRLLDRDHAILVSADAEDLDFGELGFSWTTSNSGTRKWKLSHSQARSPEMHSASGNGSADDTRACQSWGKYSQDGDRLTSNGIYAVDETVRILNTIFYGGVGTFRKSGVISRTNLSADDPLFTQSLVSVEGRGAVAIGLKADNPGFAWVNTATSDAWGIAACNHDVSLVAAAADGFIRGIVVPWSSNGFRTQAEGWTGEELTNVQIIGARVTNCRADRTPGQTSNGAGIISFSSHTKIDNAYVTAHPSEVPTFDPTYKTWDIPLLHGIKIEDLAERHPDGTDQRNDYGGHITNSTVIGPFQHSIYVEGNNNVAVSNPVVIGTGREGVKLAGANITLTGGYVEIGGYRDRNPAVGVYMINGANHVGTSTIIAPWRNHAAGEYNTDPTALDWNGVLIGIENSMTDYYGVRTSGVGAAKIQGFVFSPAIRHAQKYSVTGTTGTIQTGNKPITNETVGAYVKARIVSALTAGVLEVGQMSGAFRAGDLLTQYVNIADVSTLVWSGTVASNDEPGDIGMEIGVYSGGANDDVRGNTILRGACRIGIFSRNGRSFTAQDNELLGIRYRGIVVQNSYGDRIRINRNLLGPPLAGAAEGIFVISFKTESEDEAVPGTVMGRLVDLDDNTYIDWPTGLRWGSTTIPAGAAVSAQRSKFINCTTPVLTPRLTEIKYGQDCMGFKTHAKLTATVPAGSTFVTVTHGLAATPTNIQVTAQGSLGAAAKVSATNRGASTFRITLDVAPGIDVLFDITASVGF